MSKRFIDTEMFDDEWFMDLSPEAKLLYIYLFTKCDHAGIINVNWKLTEFQTGIKDLRNSKETLTKELGNRLVSMENNNYFLPKFIWFQYPGFPNSRVRQQASAIELLKRFDLFDNSTQSLNKELVEYYENVNGNVSDNDNEQS